VFSLV